MTSVLGERVRAGRQTLNSVAQRYALKLRESIELDGVPRIIEEIAANPTERAFLQSTLDMMDAAVDSWALHEDISRHALLSADAMFHLALWRMADPTILDDAFELMNHKLLPVGHSVEIHLGYRQDTVRIHHDIFDALIDGDHAAARSAIQKHYWTARSWLGEYDQVSDVDPAAAARPTQASVLTEGESSPKLSSEHGDSSPDTSVREGVIEANEIEPRDVSAPDAGSSQSSHISIPNVALSGEEIVSEFRKDMIAVGVSRFGLEKTAADELVAKYLAVESNELKKIRRSRASRRFTDSRIGPGDIARDFVDQMTELGRERFGLTTTEAERLVRVYGDDQGSARTSGADVDMV
jgi:hypothetical protein